MVKDLRRVNHVKVSQENCQKLTSQGKWVAGSEKELFFLLDLKLSVTSGIRNILAAMGSLDSDTS